VFGATANALVIYALNTQYAHGARKRAVNLLVINRNLLSNVGHKNVIWKSRDINSNLKRCTICLQSL